MELTHDHYQWQAFIISGVSSGSATTVLFMGRQPKDSHKGNYGQMNYDFCNH
jgi:hypothetical protein